jgi:sodium-dependent dicarboxylate transporter 2/3/5
MLTGLHLQSINMKKPLTILLLLLLAFGIIYPFAPLDPLPKAGLCILVVIAGLWSTEALPIPITALLIPILATALGIGSLADNLAPFASPVVFLVFGGFILSTVLHKHGLDHWFAAITLRHCGAHTGKVLIGMFAITAFLSMWMSNASATLMMLPILYSVLQRLPEGTSSSTSTFALLGLAYSSSLGGMVTLVGSPTNMIIAAQLDIDFFQWMKLIGPVAIFFFPVMLGIMAWKLKPQLNYQMDVNIPIPILNGMQRPRMLLCMGQVKSL